MGPTSPARILFHIGKFIWNLIGRCVTKYRNEAAGSDKYPSERDYRASISAQVLLLLALFVGRISSLAYLSGAHNTKFAIYLTNLPNVPLEDVGSLRPHVKLGPAPMAFYRSLLT